MILEYGIQKRLRSCGACPGTRIAIYRLWLRQGGRRALGHREALKVLEQRCVVPLKELVSAGLVSARQEKQLFICVDFVRWRTSDFFTQNCAMAFRGNAFRGRDRLTLLPTAQSKPNPQGADHETFQCIAWTSRGQGPILIGDLGARQC